MLSFSCFSGLILLQNIFMGVETMVGLTLKLEMSFVPDYF